MSRRSHRQRSGRTPIRSTFEVLRNPYPPTEVLSEESIEAIHQASLQILEEVGLDIWDSESRRIFKQGGAQVDEAQKRVHLDRGLVLERVSQAPNQFTLHARDPDKNLPIGGDRIIRSDFITIFFGFQFLI